MRGLLEHGDDNLNSARSQRSRDSLRSERLECHALFTHDLTPNRNHLVEVFLAESLCTPSLPLRGIQRA